MRESERAQAGIFPLHRIHFFYMMWRRRDGRPPMESFALLLHRQLILCEMHADAVIENCSQSTKPVWRFDVAILQEDAESD
jgi:hypothetical protein